MVLYIDNLKKNAFDNEFYFKSLEAMILIAFLILLLNKLSI